MTDTPKVTEQKKSDVFITEGDTFDISIKYYNKNGKLFVKKIDDDFDDSASGIRTIDITFKYPSQGDCMMIERNMESIESATENLKTFLRMEYNRFLILARKWNLPEKLEESEVLRLRPKMIKAIFQELREKIDMDGII